MKKLLSTLSLNHKFFPFLFFVFGIWFFCLRILGIGLEFIPGDLGDSRFINFLLEHGHQWLHGNTDGFWDANFMYPFPNTIAISDNMLGTMPLYSLFRSLGFSIETSYQLWWIGIYSLNYWITYLVVKKWFNRTDIAIIVAWIFAFSIFNLGQLSYLQMSIRFMVPVAFYAATKMIETKQLKYFIIYIFSIVIQFYSVIYTGFFLLYFSVFYIIIYAILKKDYFFFKFLFTKKNILKTILSTSVAVGAMLILILPYLHIADVLGYRTYAEVEGMLPTWKSYLFPNNTTVIWSFLHENFKPNEFYWLHYNFIGLFPTIILIAIPFLWIYWKIKKIKPSTLVLGTTVSIFIIFLFYFKFDNGYSLYEYLFNLPGMKSIRVMNRYLHVLLFLILILFSVFLLKIPKKWVAIIFLFVILDNSFYADSIYRQEKKVIAERRTSTLELVKNNRTEKDIAFAIINPNEAFFMTHIDAMLTALELNFPTLNGYSSHGPVEHSEFFQNDNIEGLERWLEFNHIPKDSVLILYRE